MARWIMPETCQESVPSTSKIYTTDHVNFEMMSLSVDVLGTGHQHPPQEECSCFTYVNTSIFVLVKIIGVITTSLSTVTESKL